VAALYKATTEYEEEEETKGKLRTTCNKSKKKKGGKKRAARTLKRYDTTVRILAWAQGFNSWSVGR